MNYPLFGWTLQYRESSWLLSRPVLPNGLRFTYAAKRDGAASATSACYAACLLKALLFEWVVGSHPTQFLEARTTMS